MPYVLRNAVTGWQGTVTERMFARLRRRDAYEVVEGTPSEEAEAKPSVAKPSVAKPSVAKPSVDSEDVKDFSEDDGGSYTIKHTGGGWYDVFGPKGEVVNETGLRKDDARALAEEKNAA